VQGGVLGDRVFVAFAGGVGEVAPSVCHCHFDCHFRAVGVTLRTMMMILRQRYVLCYRYHHLYRYRYRYRYRYHLK